VCSSDLGWRDTVLAVEQGEQALCDLLRLGAEVEVLDPPELRRALAEEAARIVALHASH
jgi:hypothetical protein